MSSISVANRIQKDLDAGLSNYEKWRIAIRFATALTAAALLCIGIFVQRLLPPEQAAIGAAFQAAAAILVLAPILCEALIGLFRESSDYYSAQLVSIASLAAFAVGDFVTAVIVPVILSIAFFLEERSVLGANSAILGLRSLQSQTATRRRSDGTDEQVATSSLQPNDIVVVAPGENIPADGIVVQGHSTVDQSSMTGESTPEEVAPDSQVFAGCININGVLQLRVTSSGDDTTLAKILELFQEAEKSKTQVLRLVEQYAKYFVLGVLLIAGITLFLTHDVSRTITVLVVGCPGPFLIAGPAAMVAAMAVASRQGILVKNASFLESLTKVNDVVFDKTGTVTTGQLEVCRVVPSDYSETDIIAAVAAATSINHHPVSRAIARHAATLDLPSQEPQEIEEVPGRGLRIVFEPDRSVMLGRETWLREEGFDVPDNVDHKGPMVWAAEISQHRKRILGAICLIDQPREDAASVVSALRRLGVERTVLLTGDRSSVAALVGQEIGADEIIAEVLPAEKLHVVEQEKRAGYDVLVVGDGINDAPALAAGSVGMAMGASGADITMRSADIVLMSHQLDRIPFAIMLAGKTQRTIHQNVLVGAGLTLLMLVLASAGMISPIAGAVLQNVGEAFVIINSAAILRWNWKLPPTK